MDKKWIEAYNRLFEIINQQGECYYSGSRFLDIIREINYSVPTYRQFIDERNEKGLSTSRKDFFLDLLQKQNEKDKIQIYKRIIETVFKFEPVKSQKILDLLGIKLQGKKEIEKLPKGLKNEVVSLNIDEIKIENFYALQKIEMQNLKDKKFIFLLGENGSGKTIFLKSLLIKLKEFYIKEVSKEIYGIFEKDLNNNPEFLMSVSGSTNKTNFQFTTANKLHLRNSYAYGTNRTKISETSKGEPFGFLTLFRDDEYLINAEQWIKEIERLELKGETLFGKQQVAEIFSDILEIPILSIKIVNQKVLFIIDDRELTLSELSEGYRSVIVLIVDLLARIIENNPEWKNTSDFKAVVLIDELDLFLHPSWEKNICSKLYKWFPDIQFFISTHSPILIDGVVKNSELSDKTAVFRFENIDNKIKIKEHVTGKQIENWLPNILISSNLFDPNYIDEFPADIIIDARTENSYAEMLKTDENIKKLQAQEEELKNKYLRNLKNKDKND